MLNFIFSLCSDYVTYMIKKLELDLLVIIILLKIKFGYTQISMPKIGILMLKTDKIYP